jgi:hypothetical protein
MDGIAGNPPGITGCQEGHNAADIVGLRKTLSGAHHHSIGQVSPLLAVRATRLCQTKGGLGTFISIAQEQVTSSLWR